MSSFQNTIIATNWLPGSCRLRRSPFCTTRISAVREDSGLAASRKRTIASISACLQGILCAYCVGRSATRPSSSRNGRVLATSPCSYVASQACTLASSESQTPANQRACSGTERLRIEDFLGDLPERFLLQLFEPGGQLIQLIQPIQPLLILLVAQVAELLSSCHQVDHAHQIAERKTDSERHLRKLRMPGYRVDQQIGRAS